MSPSERAKLVLGADWLGDLEAHLLNGYVLSSPDAFLMGRPVPRGAEISDAWQVWPRAECDAWFVWCGVGDWRALLAWMPFPLPWLGWVRRGRGWRGTHWVETKGLVIRKTAVTASRGLGW